MQERQSGGFLGYDSEIVGVKKKVENKFYTLFSFLVLRAGYHNLYITNLLVFVMNTIQTFKLKLIIAIEYLRICGFLKMSTENFFAIRKQNIETSYKQVNF